MKRFIAHAANLAITALVSFSIGAACGVFLNSIVVADSLENNKPFPVLDANFEVKKVVPVGDDSDIETTHRMV